MLNVSFAVRQRQNIERRIVRMVVRCLLADGYLLNVDNGGDGYEIPWSADEKTVLAAMFATDEEHLVARKEGRVATAGWVFFVYGGNDGWDVINDNTVNLEAVLAPITAYIDTKGGKERRKA